MRWNLTQAVPGEPEIDVREDDEDLELGFRLMKALAESGEVPYRWSDTGSGPGVMRPVLGED